MFKSAHFERRMGNRKRSFWDALGPFPRSVWIHPHTPEDALDRICLKIWKRSVWAQRAVWPHLPEYADRFADDPPAKDAHNCALTQLHSSRPGLSGTKLDVDELTLMVQREMVQTLDQQHDTIIPCQQPSGSLCFHGDNQDDLDKPKEVIDIKETQRRIIEKFLKDVLMPNQDKKKQEVSEGLSLEDFPPLPCTALPCEDRPGQKAHIRKEASSNIPSSAFGSQACDDLAGPRAQKNQKRQKRQRLKPMVFSKEAITEAIQSTQASKALNEPCNQLPGSRQPGDVTEAALDDEKMNKKQGHSSLPVFAEIRTGRWLMNESLPITGGRGLRSGTTDRERVAHDPAGAHNKSTRRAAGPLEKAKSRRVQQGKTLHSASDEVSVPKGHMASEQAFHHEEAEHRTKSFPPQKVAMLQALGHRPTAGLPAPAHPAPHMPLHLPPGFHQPQMDPQSVALALLLLSSGLPLPSMGVAAPAPVHMLHPLNMSADAWKRLLNSDNFLHTVTPQGVSSQDFVHTPDGFQAVPGDTPRVLRRHL
ncbi:uncharacterized protein c19h1orf94 isoform X2 [Brachyhypopomus gauderio]|uniref:uncharacterized protein c19h1orf94 isoform X2 n=1 Tax=Brachyhypopomus gauderio TaxID=698409 RepID=UPI0040438000